MAARTPSTHDRVLVLQATGKLGGGVARGLMATGLFEVYGTTRSAKGAAALEAAGVHAIIANYIVRADVDRAIAESGATKLVFLTDYVLAANSSAARETEQGKMMVDAAKAAGISHAIFLSIADAQFFSPKALHVHAKLAIEAYLKESGLRYSILRPYVFFENLDDAANWNPLKKGSVKFLSECPTMFVSTFDVGVAAAAMLKAPAEWAGKTLECASVKVPLTALAAALSKVSGVPVTASLAMPICLRSIFLSYLHHMLLFFEEGYPGSQVDMEAFNRVVASQGFTAMDAEAWFRYHGVYANGKKIVA